VTRHVIVAEGDSIGIMSPKNRDMSGMASFFRVILSLLKINK